jgi:putative ABC transport system permease protein
LVESWLRDCRLAVRSLKRDRTLTLTAALMLSLCIEANTMVFSLVDSILPRRLPFPGSQRIYWVSERMRRDQTEVGLGPDYSSLREENRVFEDVAAYDTLTVNWNGIEEPEQLDAAQVTPSFFDVMGTQPMMGRRLAAGEEGRDALRVVVLSYAFWRGRMDRDPRVVGKTILLDRVPHTVIGVMPQGFAYPRGTQVWRPIPMDEASQRPRSVMRPMRMVQMVARLKPGVSQRRLETELSRLTHMIRGEYPNDFHKVGFLGAMRIEAMPLQRRLTGDVRPALLVLIGAFAGMAMLLAALGVYGVMSYLVARRGRELGVRVALGARPEQVRDLVLRETTWLVTLAAMGGLAGAWGLTRYLRTIGDWDTRCSGPAITDSSHAEGI